MHKNTTGSSEPGGGGLDFYFYIFPLVGSVKPLFHSCPEIPDRPGLIATETIKNDSKLNVGLTGTDLWTIIHFPLIFSPPTTLFFVFTLKNDISEHA